MLQDFAHHDHDPIQVTRPCPFPGPRSHLPAVTFKVIQGVDLSPRARFVGERETRRVCEGNSSLDVKLYYLEDRPFSPSPPPLLLGFMPCGLNATIEETDLSDPT